MPRHHGARGALLAPAVLEFATSHRDHMTLSAYLEGRNRDPASRHKWAVELKQDVARQRRTIARRSREELKVFDACVTRLTELLPAEDELHRSEGWACFVSDSGGVLAEQLTFAVAPGITWQRGPRIAPYLGAVAPPHAIVVVADRQHAQLYRLADGTISPLERLTVESQVEVSAHMGSAPRRGFHTGTRGETQRDAASRRLREQRVRHVAATANRAAVLAGTDADVVVGGVKETAAHIVEALPTSLAARTVCVETLRASMSPVVLARRADEALLALTGSRQLALASALLDDVGSKGHAALGVYDVIRALEQRAVDHLLVSPALIAQEPMALDGIVTEALAEGADTETALPDAASLLDSAAGGIVARLRFPVTTLKLRTRSPGKRSARERAILV